VSCEDYPGLFAPFGYQGFVEIGKLGLIECPQHRVEAAKQAQAAAAHKLVYDWREKWGAAYEGQVTVGTQTELDKLDTVQTTKIGATKTIEDTTKIPRDMVPYIAQIFEERDRLAQAHVDSMKTRGHGYSHEWASWMEDHPDDPQWPTLNRVLLPTAIDIVRKRITEEATSGEAS
jgi:hypothetical protein